MPESTQGEVSPVGASFAAHVQEFHRSLPPEEQALLEQVFELAASAAGEQAEVQGFDISFSSAGKTHHFFGSASSRPLAGGGGSTTGG